MERNKALDIAKGIGIILMVIGHCYSEENLVINWINSFHMPLFFMISGILFSIKYEDIITFDTIKKIKTYVIPFVFYDFIISCFIWILNYKNFTFDKISYWLISIISLKGNSVMWFIGCLLLVELLVKFLINVTRNKIIVLFVSIILASIALLGIDIYITIQRVFVGLMFFVIGYCFKKIIIEYKPSTIIITFILSIILGNLNGSVSLASVNFSNPILYIINGLLGSYFVIQISLYFSHKNYTSFLTKFGKNTIILLGTHMFLVEIIRLLDYKLFNNLLPRFGIFEGIIFGFGIIIFYVVVYIYANKILKGSKLKKVLIHD